MKQKMALSRRRRGLPCDWRRNDLRLANIFAFECLRSASRPRIRIAASPIIAERARQPACASPAPNDNSTRGQGYYSRSTPSIPNGRCAMEDTSDLGHMFPDDAFLTRNSFFADGGCDALEAASNPLFDLYPPKDVTGEEPMPSEKLYGGPRDTTLAYGSQMHALGVNLNSPFPWPVSPLPVVDGGVAEGTPDRHGSSQDSARAAAVRTKARRDIAARIRAASSVSVSAEHTPARPTVDPGFFAGVPSYIGADIQPSPCYLPEPVLTPSLVPTPPAGGVGLPISGNDAGNAMHVAPELCVSHLMACQDSTPQCVRAVRHTMSMLLAGSGLSANGIRKSDIVELERLILDPTVLAQGIGLFSPSNVVISAMILWMAEPLSDGQLITSGLRFVADLRHNRALPLDPSTVLARARKGTTAYMPGRVIVDLGARTQRHWPGLQLQAQARAYLMTHFYQPSGQAIVKTRFVRSRRQMI